MCDRFPPPSAFYGWIRVNELNDDHWLFSGVAGGGCSLLKWANYSLSFPFPHSSINENRMPTSLNEPKKCTQIHKIFRSECGKKFFEVIEWEEEIILFEIHRGSISLLRTLIEVVFTLLWTLVLFFSSDFAKMGFLRGSKNRWGKWMRSVCLLSEGISKIWGKQRFLKVNFELRSDKTWILRSFAKSQNSGFWSHCANVRSGIGPDFSRTRPESLNSKKASIVPKTEKKWILKYLGTGFRKVAQVCLAQAVPGCFGSTKPKPNATTVDPTPIIFSYSDTAKWNLYRIFISSQNLCFWFFGRVKR